MSLDPIGAARLLAARLCHDLGGMTGTLAGTLDLVGGGDPAMLDLARETATTLRLRMRLYAAAWGGGAGDLDALGLLALLEGAPAVPRVRFALEGAVANGAGADPAAAALPARLVPLVLNAAMLASEALPRGGTVRIGGDARTGLTVVPDGRGAAWPAGFAAAIAGTQTPEALLEAGGPRGLLAPLVVLAANEAGWSASLALSAGPGATPLVLSPNATASAATAPLAP